MHHFAYRDGRLFAEEIPLEKIAQGESIPEALSGADAGDGR